jgi:hypothetical protein
MISRCDELFRSPAIQPGRTEQKKMKDEKQNPRARLGEFMGHSVVSVIRAMGAAGWTFKEAQAALAKVAPAENTIRIQLRAGAKKLAPPADIDPQKLEALRPALPASDADKKPSRAQSKASGKSPKAKK